MLPKDYSKLHILVSYYVLLVPFLENPIIIEELSCFLAPSSYLMNTKFSLMSNLIIRTKMTSCSKAFGRDVMKFIDEYLRGCIAIGCGLKNHIVF